MQVKIHHDLFLYLWECFAIQLKTSCKGEFLLEIPLGRHTGASSGQQFPPAPLETAWKGTSRTCSSAKTTSFHCSSSCPGVIQCAGLTRLRDKSRFIWEDHAEEGGTAERRFRKIIQTTSCRSTRSSLWKIHVDKSMHLLLLRLTSSEIKIRISGIEDIYLAQSGFELIFLAKSNFFIF